MRQDVLKKIMATQGKQVDLAHMQIKDDEIQEIFRRLKQDHPTIAEIHLDGNHLGDEGALVLAECLREFPQLTVLHLQFNKIGEKGATAVFSLKANLPNLDILFHGNKIYRVDIMDEIEKKSLFSKGC
jgi:Ran GTPase-activating protein (RanGAP) involved in mRNA processing and transport